MTLKERFETMTEVEHKEMKRKLLELAKDPDAERPSADSLMGYALAQYTSQER
jgi:hypothetical protein